MNFTKKFILTAATAALFAGCASSTVSNPEPRYPAGTGDIGSSVPEEIKLSLESYKLPIVRGAKTSLRMAHNFWGSEWPGPVMDVQSSKKSGTTTITGFTSLRNPGTDRVSCTIKNGVYHPWSKSDTSIINYYTLAELLDFKVVSKVVRGDGEINSKVKTTYPVGAEILNVVYYGENWCGATLKIGKNLRPVNDECPFFTENPNFKRTSPPTDMKNQFREQWLYFACDERGPDGKPLKVFVQDEDLLKQSGVQQGCFAEYGSATGADSKGECR